MEYDLEQFHVFDPEEMDDDHYSRITYRGEPFVLSPGPSEVRDGRLVPLSWFPTGIQLFHAASKDWFEEPLTLDELSQSFVQAEIPVEGPDRLVEPSIQVKGIRFNSTEFFWVIETEIREIQKESKEIEELSEFDVNVDGLPLVDLHLDKLSIYKVYEFLNQKIKDSMAEEIRGIFTSKKIKTRLDFSEVFDDEAE
jgi:hypothetical protein